MKNKVFIIVTLVVAVATFSLFTLLNKPAPTVQVPASTTAEFVRSHSPVFGNSLARVTVVEWFDPECESCRVMHPVFKDLVKTYEDRVRFVLRYMPYHGNSMYAASALEEAREYGKYEQALDVLFEKQPLWGDHHEPRPELIVTYLTELGIPKEKLEAEYLIKKHGEKIEIDQLDGNELGVRGTPTFYVNGRQLQSLGEAPLRDAIEQALAEAQ